MPTDTKLSTCETCGSTIERRPTAVAGWGHLTETWRNADGHIPRPDDSHVSTDEGRDEVTCEFCGVPEDDDCADDCGCHACEISRAADEAADQYAGNIND